MTNIDTGDVVFHAPTKERWLVACVQGDRLSWCGWPEGTAALKDCTLVTKATPEAKDKLLHELAAMRHDSDHRARYARNVLAQRLDVDGTECFTVDTPAIEAILQRALQRLPSNQRLWDLIRHQRSELHEVGLITDDEYAQLAEDHAAVARLEDYDNLRAKLQPSPCPNAEKFGCHNVDWVKRHFFEAMKPCNEPYDVYKCEICKQQMHSHRYAVPSAWIMDDYCLACQRREREAGK